MKAIEKAKDAKKKVNKARKIIKAIQTFIAALPWLLKLFIISICMLIGIGLVDLVIAIFFPQKTSQEIYNIFDVEDVKELVAIKKSEDDSGYYLDFIDGFDEKVKEVIEGVNDRIGTFKIPRDEAFLKKIIKAEVITQFPNLGGNIPENSDGFQGTVDIRRVTPNKEIGSISDNPGRGETSNIEPEITHDTVDENILEEEKVKTWSKGQALILTSKAKVYAQKESQLNPGSDTGAWYVVKKEGASNEDLTIEGGTEVTYTGIYKKNVNILNNSLSKVYIEVKKGDFTGYISASLVEKKEKQEDEKEEKSETKRKETTSRAKEDNREQEETIGKLGRNYTIAIAAGHNNTDDKGVTNGDLVEEELTIKTAEKVEKLLAKYKNIKVVQVGSTSSNPGGITIEERTEKVREAKPNLCIQIHYNAGGGTGVDAIYKDGDGISRQLAEILSETIASSMGLPNLSAGTDIEKLSKSLGMIENATITGFPAVVTEGGFIDGDPDAKLLKDDGTDKYAQGIVDGIKKYLEADHAGYTATNITEQTTQESISSRVYDLKYIEPQELEDWIAKANEGDNQAKDQVLKVYTLDENNNLVTVAWKAENGKITYQKNASISLATSLAKYVMPYEYLLYFYTNTTSEIEFSERLADEIIDNTEIVIAIQDNIMTTKTEENKIQWTEATDDKYQEKEKTVETTSNILETCNPKIEITYADTWFAKFYKKNSYSTKALDWEGEKEKQLNIKGKVNQSSSNSETSGERIDSGTYETTSISWETYQKTKTTIDSMTITYDSGETKEPEGNEHKFVQIYHYTNMKQWVRPEYLFRLLEGNEKTANLVELTKYLIYKATMKYYDDVIEFDFKEYNIGNFQSNGSGNYYGGSMEEKVWWALLEKGYSKEATAGVMGNLQQESGFRSNNLEDKFNRILGYTDEAYTEAVNNGSYTLEMFISDHTKPGNGAGYGLAQWTSAGRKKGLYDLVKSKGVGIDDENAQIEYLLMEMSEDGGGFISASGRAAFMQAQTPEEACDAFFKYFEMAGDSSEGTRQGNARAIYSAYANQTKPASGTASKLGWSTKGVSCPRYYQSDGRWAMKLYNYGPGKTIGQGGCGACALAMATSGLLGEDITPDIIVEYLNSINKNTVYNGAGSAYAIAQRYGLTYEVIDRRDKPAIDAALDAGKICIFSIYANGIYTGGGHFIMCNGREGDQYYVLESGRFYTTDQGYSYDQVFSSGSQGVFVLGK